MKEVNPSTTRPEGLGLPFDKPFGRKLRAEWLKAPSIAEGLRVDPERSFLTPS